MHHASKTNLPVDRIASAQSVPSGMGSFSPDRALFVLGLWAGWAASQFACRAYRRV